MIYFPQAGHADSLRWQSASTVAPSGLLEQVVKENFESSFQSRVNSAQMKLLTVMQPQQQIPLYIIDTRTDYNNPSANFLCGAAGCNFLGYIRTKAGYQRVFSYYLNPALPENLSIIEPTRTIRNGLPCLVFNQPIQNSIEKIKACFDGRQYRTD
ncbi:MAG: hypothetical protein HC820_04975 [Hydrococcus sp. RM1_1_31]|nr:hypothetical protein [Hydrococcus sp. RM1_1_31]